MEPSGREIRVVNKVKAARRSRRNNGDYRDVSAEFAVLTAFMACVAISFVVAPLFRHERRMGSASIAAILPLFAIGLYLAVGSPQAADLGSPEASPLHLASDSQSPRKKTVGSVASMVDGLAERLKSNPDDGKSWLLLARSYKHLQRMPVATAAYQHAAALGEYDEDLALMVSAAPAANATAVQVNGRVELSPDSETLTRPTDTVFVFARAIDGPPMPVAVLQRPVAELPFDFHLDDSHSMSDAARLSDYDRVIVSARITRASDARNALRGLQARSDEIVVADHQPIRLTIDQQEQE